MGWGGRASSSAARLLRKHQRSMFSSTSLLWRDSQSHPLRSMEHEFMVSVFQYGIVSCLLESSLNHYFWNRSFWIAFWEQLQEIFIFIIVLSCLHRLAGKRRGMSGRESWNLRKTRRASGSFRFVKNFFCVLIIGRKGTGNGRDGILEFAEKIGEPWDILHSRWCCYHFFFLRLLSCFHDMTGIGAANGWAGILKISKMRGASGNLNFSSFFVVWQKSHGVKETQTGN